MEMMIERGKATFWLGVSLLFCLGTRLLAQPEPMEWGKVPKSDLAMTSWAGDTIATAVILCDYGRAWFTENFELILQRHTRIEIFSEGGLIYGTVTISFFAKDSHQGVTDLNTMR